MRVQWGLNSLLVIFIGILIFGLLHFRDEHKRFEGMMLEKTEANRTSINYISAGMSLSEKRLRQVLQTERIIGFYNDTLKSEFIHSLALIIVDAASKYPNLTHLDLCALIAIESRFNPNALSKMGAKGLTQIMDQTAEFICNRFAWGYVDGIAFDPEKNVLMGAFYLNYLIEWNKKDKEVALANYNGGHKYSVAYKLLKSGDSSVFVPQETLEYPQKFSNTLNFLSKKFAFTLQEDSAQTQKAP